MDPDDLSEKKESGKIRLITNLRDLNKCHTVPKHRAETWSTLKTLLCFLAAGVWGMPLYLIT